MGIHGCGMMRWNAAPTQHPRSLPHSLPRSICTASRAASAQHPRTLLRSIRAVSAGHPRSLLRSICTPSAQHAGRVLEASWWLIRYKSKTNPGPSGLTPQFWEGAGLPSGHSAKLPEVGPKWDQLACPAGSCRSSRAGPAKVGPKEGNKVEDQSGTSQLLPGRPANCRSNDTEPTKVEPKWDQPAPAR